MGLREWGVWLGALGYFSESLPQKYVNHLSGAAGQRGKKTLNGQVEDLSAELDLEMTHERKKKNGMEMKITIHRSKHRLMT